MKTALQIATTALLLAPLLLDAQAKPGSPPTPPPPVGSTGTSAPPDAAPEKHITPAQAKELFASIDPILHFASDDSKLPVRHSVKRRLTNREQVEHYVLSKFKEDKDTQRLERSEIVLKKFGLLERDFPLQRFIISLLTEQIAGYYDSKSKTVNLLDWIEPDQQKPVLAHELTHALQDQHVDLEKWADQSVEGISHTVEDDNRHLASDEVDTARDAVAEGQAMVVFLDWSLKPSGRSLETMPDVADQLGDEMDDPHGSPVLSRAPLLLKESLLFPYRAGLHFEQTVLKDEGATTAFAEALDRPPGSSFEVMNPPVWEHHGEVPLLRMPDVHTLLDAAYEPYDIGVMGQLDVRILTELFGGHDVAAALTPQWNGGLYYAAQSRQAITAQQQSSPASLALFYLSRWRTPAAAAKFADVYATNLPRKYTRAVPRAEDASNDGATPQDHDRIFDTEEGPVLISVSGNQVFVSESFDVDTARKLQFLLTGAQSSPGQQTASNATSSPELTGDLRRMLNAFGTMRITLPH